MAVQAWSGAAVTSPFDVQNGAVNANFPSTSTTIQVGSVTPTLNDELIVATASINSAGDTSTVDSGMTTSDTVTNVAATAFGINFAYKIQTAATSINPTFTLSAAEAELAGAIATFKAATGNWFNFF